MRHLFCWIKNDSRTCVFSTSDTYITLRYFSRSPPSNFRQVIEYASIVAVLKFRAFLDSKNSLSSRSDLTQHSNQSILLSFLTNWRTQRSTYDPINHSSFSHKKVAPPIVLPIEDALALCSCSNNQSYPPTLSPVVSLHSFASVSAQ